MNVDQARELASKDFFENEKAIEKKVKLFIKNTVEDKIKEACSKCLFHTIIKVNEDIGYIVSFRLIEKGFQVEVIDPMIFNGTLTNDAELYLKIKWTWSR